MSAPVNNCCGGGMVISDMGTMGVPMGIPMEGTVISGVESLPVEGAVAGETILEAGEATAVQTSPSDSTVTSDIVEPPASAEPTGVAPEEQN